jgi:NitT/TauT family transport system substrate-binding protein
MRDEVEERQNPSTRQGNLMKKIGLNARMLAFALAGVLAVAVGGPAGGQAVVSMQIASGPTIGARTALYGVDAGIFKKYGLDVQVVRAASGGGSPLSGLIGNSLQADYVNVISLAQAHVKGINLQIIAPGGMYNTEAPFALLFVPKDSPIKSARDLDGKTICSQSLQDLNALATLAWIDANGGDSKTVHDIELPNSAMLPALDAGRVDATALVPPYQTAAAGSGKYRVLGKPYDGIAKHFAFSGWAATADFIAQNPDAVRRFAAAMREANLAAKANPVRADELVAEFSGIDVKTVARSVGSEDPVYLEPSDLQPAIDASAKYGLIAKSFAASEIVNPAVEKPAGGK